MQDWEIFLSTFWHLNFFHLLPNCFSLLFLKTFFLFTFFFPPLISLLSIKEANWQCCETRRMKTEGKIFFSQW